MTPETTANLVLLVAMVIGAVFALISLMLGVRAFKRTLYAKDKPAQTNRRDIIFLISINALIGIVFTMLALAYPQFAPPLLPILIVNYLMMALLVWAWAVLKRLKPKRGIEELLATDELPEGVEPAELLTSDEVQDLTEAIGRQPRVAVVQKPGEF